MPLCVGSTTPSNATAAIAASIALPPRRMMSSAVNVASGCDVAAMTLVPNASERPGTLEIAHHVVTERQGSRSAGR